MHVLQGLHRRLRKGDLMTPAYQPTCAVFVGAFTAAILACTAHLDDRAMVLVSTRAKQNWITVRVEVRLINPTEGVWSYTHEENLAQMYDSREPIDEAALRVARDAIRSLKVRFGTT